MRTTSERGSLPPPGAPTAAPARIVGPPVAAGRAAPAPAWTTGERDSLLATSDEGERCRDHHRVGRRRVRVDVERVLAAPGGVGHARLGAEVEHEVRPRDGSAADGVVLRRPALADHAPVDLEALVGEGGTGGVDVLRDDALGRARLDGHVLDVHIEAGALCHPEDLGLARLVALLLARRRLGG